MVKSTWTLGLLVIVAVVMLATVPAEGVPGTVTRFSGSATGIGLGEEQAAVRIVGRFETDPAAPFDGAAATVTLHSVLFDGLTDVSAGFPVVLFPDPRNTATTFTYRSIAGARPLVRLLVRRTKPGVFSFRLEVSRAASGVPPGGCPTPALETSFQISPVLATPIEVATTHTWLCFGTESRYLKTIASPVESPGLVTQTFLDLAPTQPGADEVSEPPVDQDRGFGPHGPPVDPAPPVLVGGHFWDSGGTFEELYGPLEGEPTEEGILGTVDQALAVPACSSVANPAEGHWRLAGATGPENSGDVAIHAALLRTSADEAAILFFAGDAHSPIESVAGRVDHTGLFKLVNPRANQFLVEKLEDRSSPRADLFCSGHAQLGDGRLLVAGGTDRFPRGAPGLGDTRRDRPSIHDPVHFTATRDAFVFDPKTGSNNWSRPFPMNFQPGPDLAPTDAGGGRWYPSLVTLNSGDVLAFWGHPANTDFRHTNDTPEFFRPDARTWEVLGRESDVQTLPCDLTFPRVHLLPNGRIFRATPVCDDREAECRVATDCKSRLCKQDDATERKNCEDRQAPKVFNVAINPRPESLSDRDEISVRVSRGPGKGYGTGDYGWTSALLPLTPGDRYRARVLLAGRPQPQYVELGTDTGAALETWRDTCPRHPAMARRDRTHANATILPTGEVFVSGGISGGAPVREGEIYDPFCGMGGCWRTVRVASVPRAYHSVALLMPDGRVWHAGTSIQKPGEKGTAAAEGKGLENQEERVELYEPWYYGRTRPVLRTMTGPRDPLYPGAPVMHLHDSGVTVVVDHFRAVTRFALIRTGAVTHAFNFDQRYVELNADLERLDLRLFPVPGLRFTFRLASPPSSNVAPPGNYLLFALDDRGVPSVGRFIRIDRRFVGELEWEAEDFTSRSGSGISVPGDGAVALSARTDPFTSFPRLEYGGIDFGPERGVVRKFSVVGRGTGDPPHGRGHGALLVHLDRPDGPVIARVALRGAPGPVEHVVDVAPVSGVHDVHIRYVTSLLGLPGDPATATARIEGFTFAP